MNTQNELLQACKIIFISRIQTIHRIPAKEAKIITTIAEVSGGLEIILTYPWGKTDYRMTFNANYNGKITYKL